MFLFIANRRKKTVLALITLLSLLVLCAQLAKFRYNVNVVQDIPQQLEDAADQTPFTPSAIQHTPFANEKYITYLPYSRFSNQRGTLLNAALLAKYLNRTLVVPPLFLGTGTGWTPAPGLYHVLANMTDTKFQEQCFDEQGKPVSEEIVLDDNNLPIFGCYNFTNYVTLPWSWATDLGRLARPEAEGGLGIRIVERKDMSLSALQEQLGVSEKDFYLMNDSTRYQWRIYDGKKAPLTGRKYDYAISIRQLAQIPERVLHFYGIFGYDRLMLSSRDSEEYRIRIREALIFRHKAIADASSIIIDQLLAGIGKTRSEIRPLSPIQAQAVGGYRDPPRFIAAHIRAGDGVFLAQLKDRVPEFVHQIWNIMTGQETTYDDLVGPSNNPKIVGPPASKLYPLPKAPRRIREYLSDLDMPMRIRECATLKQTVLYVATDAPSPRSNPDMAPLIDAFPCTFFMEDFSNEWKAPLMALRSPLDKHKPLTEYLMMFVDATICSWAERFVGTRTSTFSSYIKEFRHALLDEIISGH